MDRVANRYVVALELRFNSLGNKLWLVKNNHNVAGYALDIYLSAGNPFLCNSGMSNRVILPRGLSGIDVVYTKTSNEGSFTLRENGGIEEYRGSLFGAFRSTNRIMYVAGYRYVHIEY